MTLTPDDIERLCALTRSPHADVRDGALRVLRRERDYWLAQTFDEWCEWSTFVWECDFWLWLYLSIAH